MEKFILALGTFLLAIEGDIWTEALQGRWGRVQKIGKSQINQAYNQF